MTTSVPFDAVSAVRHHFELADQEGRPRPGRPTLITATGLSDHKIKMAIAAIKGGKAMSTPAGDGVAQPSGDTSPAIESVRNLQNRATASTGDSQPRTGGRSGSPAADLAPARAGDAVRNTSGFRGGTSGNPSLTRSGTPSPGQPEDSPSEGTSNARITSKPPAHQHLGAGDQPPTLPAPDPTQSPTSGTSGLVVSWAGFLFGAVMSIAANVLHTWLPADTQPPGWAPGIGPQIGAGVWPVTLVLSVEVLSRVHWQRGWHWYLVRFGGGGIITVGSFAISYGHIYDLLTAWHYRPIAATIGPLVLDGLMTISGFGLLTCKQSNTRATEEPEEH